MCFYLSSSPVDEECASVGDDFYSTDARIETSVYIEQLQRMFNFHHDDLGISFSKKRERHDFGAYYEVVVDVDFTHPAALSLAQTIENHPPLEWDLPAIRQIISKTAARTFDPKDLTANGSFSWVNTAVVTVEQGRRVLALVRKVRSGNLVTTNEVLANLEPDPDVQSCNEGVAKRFVVMLAHPSSPAQIIESTCFAASAELAIQEISTSHPGYQVLMHFSP